MSLQNRRGTWTKTFDGKRYRLKATYRTKKQAKDVAGQLRRAGDLARVTKTPERVQGMRHPGKWAVWRRTS